MITYPDIDPVAIAFGPIKIYWYGLMYLLGFSSAWGLALLRAKQAGNHWTVSQVSDLIFYGALGVILGGRIGYMLFYATESLLHNPLSLFKVWQGGMSFHGGLLGVVLAFCLFSYKQKISIFIATDFIAPMVPIGLAAGRIGNFINSELWGRVTDVPWAMVFPNAGPLPRHPSQLYEFFFEGVVLFIILWFYSAKPRPRMAVSGMFLFWYGVFRIFCEFFRQPDLHIGFLAFDWLTEGQLLSVPMVMLGAVLLWLAYRNPPKVK